MTIGAASIGSPSMRFSRPRTGLKAASAALGLELVRFTVEGGSLGQTKWLLHTRDMHRLYSKIGFAAPDGRAMERWPTR